ncbi:transcriptional regulator [Anoxybacillus ayderensis]|uniref:spr1629 family repressor/antitoxin n=1 Tax=Anoxybacillus sp. ST70 TaxID=2864180 RepID=UPI0002D2E008|nr:XRE family transcriptional regulator [uncultured Anoxybacillus sp.]AXM89370.1 ImmA/IrrE family metallo-endopeptidase [Anoxybacillus ayderensis G10]MBW9219387.1 XRE family transcriptional regulator [Anoxybacillus sp. ST70]THD16131.1 transcriptional regulator [Anoxybacillus ayderensis]
MFVGESLINMRILHNLSRRQLAEKVGVTEQAIWQYENGYAFPKLEVVNKLKTIFNVKATYFYKPDLLNKLDTDNIKIQHIAYRSETINSLNKSQSELMHVRFVDAFLRKIEKKVSYPRNVLLELRRDTIKFLKDNPEMDRERQIKYIAELARERIGLDKESNKNLLFLLEKAGAFILEKEFAENIDAYSLWTEDDRAYIILGSVKKSAVRRNFDLAHELGHLLLHYKVEFTMQDKKSYKLLEDEAHAFASEFLLPEEIFRRDCEGIVKLSNPDAYIDIKQKWNVSLQAIAIRAFKLNIIDYQQYRYYYMLINKKGYKNLEPLDDKIPIERPMKIRSILRLLFEKNIYSVSSLMNELRVDESFFTVLTGIEEEFFKKYRELETKIFSVSELGIEGIK